MSLIILLYIQDIFIKFLKTLLHPVKQILSTTAFNIHFTSIINSGLVLLTLLRGRTPPPAYYSCIVMVVVNRWCGSLINISLQIGYAFTICLASNQWQCLRTCMSKFSSVTLYIHIPPPSLTLPLSLSLSVYTCVVCTGAIRNCTLLYIHHYLVFVITTTVHCLQMDAHCTCNDVVMIM